MNEDGNMEPNIIGEADDHLDAPAMILCHLDHQLYNVKFRVKIDKVLNVIVTNVKINQSVKSDIVIFNMTKFWELLKKLESSQMCSGSGFDCQKSSETCTVFLQANEKYKKQATSHRYESCRQLRKKICNKLYRPKIDVDEQNKRLKLELNDNKTLKEAIDVEREKCASASESVIEKEILSLPPIQQESVRACFAAAKLKNSKSRRYTIEWVYECLLIRIKSAAVTVVNLATKIMQWKKHSTLLLDEIALSEAVKLNQRTMQLDRFVDLGSYKPEGALNIRADHALVFMFQPFQCNWVQVIGCFLSRSATVSDILHKLIIECVILLENAGYKVDAVTCDGAQWNRGTPDDYVYRRHWEALLAYECSFKANMSITYKLTSGHIKPEQYQNINFFSKRLRVAMQMYEDQCSELKSCKSTIQFMERVDRLITAMTSRTPENALRPDIFCKMRETPWLWFSAAKNEWLKKLDAIVEEGIANGTVEDKNDNDENEDTTDEVQEAYCRKPFESLVDDSDSDNYENDLHHEHDNDVVKSSHEIVAYIAGFMIRKTSRYTKCFTCIDTLQSTNKSASGRDKFI
ncbi:hypothetical protein PV325_009229, partial [Microctonus aethiopoides]